ncbi:hypothetical protein P148_SR1C00001G0975 [candidate division SR1 bacterium RAAC1_SR1_1]|nr:hypothetical protein P148_SR1C00001G0975 [candidate division SR1 bacterium RAAC1_SR1_1]
MSSLNAYNYDENIDTIESDKSDILEKNIYSEEKAQEFKKGLDAEKDTTRRKQNKIVNQTINEFILASYPLNEGGEEHLKKKFLKIGDCYENGVKAVEITKGVNNGADLMGIYQKKIKENEENIKTTDKEEKIQMNFNKLVETCKGLGKRNKEHIFALISTDGSIHLVNDIDTGHYIIPKGLIENGDIGSLAKPNKIDPNKMERGGDPFNLEDQVLGDKLLEVGKNESLTNSKN